VNRANTEYYKWIATAVTIGAVSYGLFSSRQAIAGLFGDGATSGKVAKLEYRLQESFYPSSVAWSADGRYLAAGSTQDSRIDIWDIPQRKIVETLHRKFPPAAIHDIAWSPNGRYLSFCDAPGVLRVYNAQTWKEIRAFGGPPGDGGCAHSAFSSDSQQLALLAPDLLEVVSTTDWKILKTVNLAVGWARGNFFNTLSYLPNSHIILIGGGRRIVLMFDGHEMDSWDGRVWFFGPTDEEPDRTMSVYRAAGDHGGGGDIRSLAPSPNGGYIVTGGNPGAGDASPGAGAVESVHVLRAFDGQLIAAPLDSVSPSRFGEPEAIAYTYDGRYIVVLHDVADGWIHILNGRTFGVIDLVHSGAFTFDVAVNKMRDEFAVGTGKEVIVWSLPN
jgi:WD40 repeat protein